MSDEIANVVAVVVPGIAVCILIGGITTIVRVLRPFSYKHIFLAGGKLNVEAFKVFAGSIAATLGGLWVVFSLTVSAPQQLDRLRLEREKARNPNVDIEIDAGIFESVDRKPTIHVEVRVKNTGNQKLIIPFQGVHLLLVARLSNGYVTSPPYRKVECSPGCECSPECQLKEWSIGELEPQGSGYYSFLTDAVEPDDYLIQFQLPISQTDTYPELRNAPEADSSKPFFWSRQTYIRVPALASAVEASWGPTKKDPVLAEQASQPQQDASRAYGDAPGTRLRKAAKRHPR